MWLLSPFIRLFARWRYPFTLPEEVASALGISLPNTRSFTETLQQLANPCCPVTRLKKFMPREQAEFAFKGATCKECFKQCSLFSFYFPEGWVEFHLTFDEAGRLRRVYLHHRLLQDNLEIPLPKK